jgi:hypothetical protein
VRQLFTPLSPSLVPSLLTYWTHQERLVRRANYDGKVIPVRVLCLQVETNSAVAAECLGENKCATNFPGPMNLGSSFNRTLWRRKGERQRESG